MHRTLTDAEKLRFRNYSASLLKEHGITFSPTDPALPAIYLIHLEMERCLKQNNLIAAKIQEASSRINPIQFHFNHAGEAWKYQIGIGVKWILWGGLVLAFISIGIWYMALEADITQARAIIRARDNFSKSVVRSKSDPSGRYYIDLKEDQGDSIKYLQEYVRIDKRTVRVFIGEE